MFDETVADELLTDYLFGQLGLDEQIQVEFALSKDPELAARLAGCRASMLAIRRLAESTLDRDLPPRIIDALKPLLEDRLPAFRPERMASWLIDGQAMSKPNGRGGNGALHHEAE